MTTVSGTTYLTLAFRRSQNAPDLVFTPQSGSDLSDWTGAPAITGTTANSDGTQTVTCRDNVPVTGNARRFMRLQVTRSP